MDERRKILATIGTSLEIVGGGLSVAQPTWQWVGYALMVLGTLPLAALALSYVPESAKLPGPLLSVKRWLKPDETTMSNDDESRGKKKTTINQHVAPNGTGYAADTMHFYGKQQFQMTEEVMAAVVSGLNDNGLKAVKVGWIGSQKSGAAAALLIPYLRDHGIAVTELGGTMMRVPPNTHPISINPETAELWIDVDK